MRRALSPPDIGTRPSVPAEPDLILIDGPRRSVDGDGGLFAAVAAAPWPGRVPIRVGPAINSLTDRAIARAPASIGWLKSDFGAGVFEDWDEHNTIHLEMPGASLASVDEAAILSGPNGPGYASDGTLIDLNKEVRFEVRASLNDTPVLSETISKAFKSISFGVADQFCVAQVGRDGRRGEWLSIPLPSP